VEALEDRQAPAVLTVNSTADTANPTDPWLSLREAIAIVNSPTLPSGLSDQILSQIEGELHEDHTDTIRFDPAAVTGPIVLAGTQLRLSLPGNTASLTIDGRTTGVTIDGNNASRVLLVDSGVQATLDHLTITHGRAPGSVYADGGGGILDHGTLTVSNSTLESNSVGGSSGSGGGIQTDGTLTVSNSTFSNNFANSDGGGISIIISTATVTVTSSTLTANTAGYGGGILTFGALSLHNSIVAGNRCTTVASGPDIWGIVTGTSSDNLVEIADRSLSGIRNGPGGNLVGNASFPIDPRLGPLADNGGPTHSHALLDDSPGRGAGSLDFASATDQRGLPRVIDGQTDLGAFQTQSAVAGPQVVVSDPAGVLDLPVDHVRLTFNHPIDPATLTVARLHLTGPGGSIPLTGVAAVPSTADQQFDVSFPIQAAPGDYALRVGPGVRDVHGSRLGSPSTRRFILFGLTGSILTVNSTADTASPTDPWLTLREAIAIVNSPSLPADLSPQIRAQISGTLHANGSDAIVFDPAQVTGPITLGGTQLELSLPSSTAWVTIDGGDGVTLDGNRASRVFYLDPGVEALFAHLNITHGRLDAAGYPGDGGGIFNDHATLTLSHSTVSANSVGFGGHGGGIYNLGTLTVSHSTLSANSASFGGGLETADTLTVSDSTLASNTADFGGGITGGATTTVTRSTLEFNSSAYGGGIDYAGTLTITDSTLRSNSASTDGGGIYIYGTLTMSNSTLSSNSATNGGGIYKSGASLATETATLTNCTLSFNSGAGIDNIGSTATFSLRNTIVAGNFGGDVFGSYTQSHNLVGGDPRLGPFGWYGGPTQTFALLPDSPARDGGDAGSSPPTDQRGLLRRAGGPTDIGAFQTQPDPFAVTTLADPGRAYGLLSVREAVALANVLPGDHTVSFADALDGGAVSLTAGELELSGTGGVEAIDGAGRFTLDGDNATRLVEVDPGTTAVLRGLALVNGNAGVGAGVYNRGSLTVADCVLYGNTAFAGGAVLNQGDLTVYGCTLGFNVATLGAAIDNEGALTAFNSTLLYNAGLVSGGAVLNQPTGTAILTSLTISLNSAAAGGGLDVLGGLVLLRNCIVAGNTSTDASAASDIAGMVDPGSTYNLIGTGGSGGLLDGVSHNRVGVADPGLTTPDFSSPQTPVFGFTADSPALGTGDPTLLSDPLLRLDQHGNLRHDPVNIGAT
jgi:hypothetical protein